MNRKIAVEVKKDTWDLFAC